MPAVGDLYTLKFNQSLFGMPVLNVFGFESTITPGTAADLAAQWITDTMPFIQAIENENALQLGVEVINQNDPGDYALQAVTGQTGDRTGESLPAYATWTFKFARTTRAVRNGFKRFAGVSESDNDNGAAASAIISDLDACATALAAPVVGTAATYVPRILRATYPIPNPTHLPAIYTGFAVGGVVYEHIGTQNTRKQY